jgi:hypothetical protein
VVHVSWYIKKICRKRQLENPKHRWEDIFQADLEEI